MDVSRSEFLFGLTIKLNACNADVLGLLAAGKLNQAESVLRSEIHDVKATLAADVDDAVVGEGTGNIDIDALLANAKIVKEPSAYDLLSRHDSQDAWWRWISRRDDRGRRAICPQCNTAFIRDMNKVRRCRKCRGASYPRDCIECAEHFDAHHFMVKRCPPCRARHGGVRCDTCNEYFVRDWWNDTSCRRCR